MIAHSILNMAQVEAGKEVLIQWGGYGRRIKNLRATITKFPCIYGVTDRQDYDLSTAPSGRE